MIPNKAAAEREPEAVNFFTHPPERAKTRLFPRGLCWGFSGGENAAREGAPLGAPGVWTGEI